MPLPAGSAGEQGEGGFCWLYRWSVKMALGFFHTSKARSPTKSEHKTESQDMGQRVEMRGETIGTMVETIGMANTRETKTNDRDDKGDDRDDENNNRDDESNDRDKGEFTRGTGEETGIPSSECVLF